ncbi:MAG TPA: two-component sensor histidine kinase, partial [Vicinamibacteria bacterium]
MSTLQVAWRRRLGLRLALGIAAVVVATGSALVALGLRAQRRQVVAEAVRGAALLSETIRNSTHQHMLEDRRQDAYSIMRTIGGQEGIEQVRIFNKEGRITFSTHPGEAGSQVDKRAESCYACHAAGQPIVRPSISSRSRIYRAGARRVLAMVTPIYNEP